ncbi:MAG: peptidylprolyl isomerase [Bacteroidota bacterium]
MAIVLLFICLINMQAETLAVVGGEAITVPEFTVRYKRFLENTGTKDNLVARSNILQIMIFERAIVHDAQQQLLMEHSTYRNEVEKVRIQSILGSYFDILADTMAITDEELRSAFVRMNTVVHARHLYAQTRSEAENLRMRLSKGESFNSLALEVFNDSKLKYSGGDLGFFRGGEMEPAFEDAVFSLPVGSISEPVKTEDGYSIIKVEQRVVRPLITENEYAEKKSKVELLVKISKRSQMAARYAQDTKQRMSPAFDGVVVQKLFSAWKANKSAERLQSSELLNAIAGRTLVSWKGNRWRVSDFSQRLFKVTDRHYRRIHSVDDLKELISGLLVQEELVRQASAVRCDTSFSYKNRVANDTTVELIRIWTDQLYKRRLSLDAATETINDPKLKQKFDAELSKEYETNPSHYVQAEERNVAEIVVDSFSIAMGIVKKLNEGASFASLARSYSVSPTSPIGGELGYGPRSTFGFFAEMIFSSAKGEIIGPVSAAGKYILLQVLDIRPSRQKSFNEARSEIRQQVLNKWKSDAQREEMERVLSLLPYTIDKEILASINL